MKRVAGSGERPLYQNRLLPSIAHVTGIRAWAIVGYASPILCRTRPREVGFLHVFKEYIYNL
jgi:hypothetical protein